MITFKNIAGNKFLAVGTIQRKSALNGEKSLTGTLYDGKDVLNKIDKGWSLEFDGEPYIVTYFEHNDNNNSVSFDAIHKFFWDMTKGVLYSETSGSHTIKWYLDTIFADTNYSYALNFDPNAIQKENWGMKNKLSLFNDIISSIKGEFEINGTLISIFRNVGTDLSTIVRYGFNLSDMTLENDASGFVTYGEGFGAYADQENQTGPRLHVTYTSPLASVYGKLQAEPVDNQNYTISNNLLSVVKAKVDASFSISVKLSLYDLTVAGYPYKMANVGDWLTAVDENLDFKQRIRIISIDDEFSADGTRIRYTVTAGDIGLTKKYQNASVSLASQVANAISSADKALADANYATIAANGKNTSYYLNSVDDLPKGANEGDLAWVQSGDGRVLYIYTKKADGSYYWEKRIDPEMGEQIQAGVEEAVSTATANATKLVNDNATKTNKTISDVDAKANQLKQDQAAFDTKAQGYADKALSSAKTNTANVAQQTAQNAQAALNQAKSELTSGIAKETADRASAVSALDTKAQGYATSAKADAISAASTADGKTRKYVDDTATTIGNTIQQNKKISDDGISTASAKAQQALDGFQNTVTKTDYNIKTGQLQTDLNKTTQTANQSKQDIVDIKQADGKQDSRMNTIESDAKGTKQTVNDVQKVQGKQTGDITNLGIRADGIEANVAKVNGIVNDLGQTNQLVNTEFSPDFAGWGRVDDGYQLAKDLPTYNGSNVVHIKTTSDGYDFLIQSIPVVPGMVFSFSSFMRFKPIGKPDSSSVYFRYSLNFYDASGINIGITYGKLNYNITDWELQVSNKVVAPSDAVNFRVNYYLRGAGEAWLAQPMLVFSDKVGAYAQGTYNNNQAIATAQLTADQATLNLKNYQTDANGRISQAQADIKATAKDVTTKVSQSDYDKKTGDLSSQVGTAQTTANEAKTTVGDYKKSNDGRMSAAESNIKSNSDAIKQTVAKTDYDANNKVITGQISSVNQTAADISKTVAQLDKDTTNKFATTNQTVSAISDIVDSNTKDLNSVTKRVTTAEGTLTSTTNRVTGVETKQTTMAGQVSQEIQDRNNGDKNTLQSAKDFTQNTISGYDTGLQSQLTQTSSAFLATISSTNLVVDSSLLDSAATNTIVNWIPSGTSKWYYSPGVSYQGVQSMGYNQTANDASYSFVDSQPWSNNSFSGTTLNVSIDIRASTIGGSSTDYLIVYLRELDVNGNLIAQTSITNTISTSNNSWVNYRKKIKVDPNSKRFFIRYQMRGNGNVYVARPYVGVQELIAGGYTAGSNNNNQTILSLFKDNWSITLSASKLTAGEVDANKINIINLDASSISAGNLNVAVKINANSITTGSLNAKLLVGDTAHLHSVDTGDIMNRYDYHLQISSYGLYNQNTRVGQLNLHSNKGSGGDWDDTYAGSITYHFETSTSGQNTGLRFWRNHIMSLNKDQNTALYLNPYAGTQVRVTSRTDDSVYYAINASAFNVASDRRFKSDIKDYEEDALEIIKSLRIRKYKKSGKREIGIIADEANDELLLKDKNGDFLSLYDYISIAVKAIQEQNAIIEDLIEKDKEDKTE